MSTETGQPLNADLTKLVVARAKAIEDEGAVLWSPPSEISRPRDEPVLSASIARASIYYVQRIIDQINVAYTNACYDPCAVMIRRLLETLIIEAFEHHGIESQIKNSAGDYLRLEELINRSLSCTSWTLGRNTKRALPRLKGTGDLSAHSRRYIAHRSDIDQMQGDLRVAAQEPVLLAGLK